MTRSHRARIPVNDLARGWLANSKAAADVAARVLHSGRFLMGEETARLECRLAEYIGASAVVTLACGTDALILAMLALELDAGSEVVLAANAGGYGSVAAAQVGVGVVYADVDASTGCLTAESVEAVVGPRTGAVLVTHLYGNVADVASISAVCRPRGIRVIEDGAQAIGGRSHAGMVGAMGDIAAFSFYPTKNLGGAGDAGAVATSDGTLAEKVNRLRQYGWTERYHIGLPRGRNSRMDEIQAALLCVGLMDLDERNRTRTAILDRFRAAAPSLAWVTGTGPTVAHLAVLRTPERTRFRSVMASRGIDTDIHYPVPDHLQPGLPPPVRGTSLVSTEAMAHEVVTVPCHPDLSEGEVRTIEDALGAVV